MSGGGGVVPHLSVFGYCGGRPGRGVDDQAVGFPVGEVYEGGEHLSDFLCETLQGLVGAGSSRPGGGGEAGDAAGADTGGEGALLVSG